MFVGVDAVDLPNAKKVLSLAAYGSHSEGSWLWFDKWFDISFSISPKIRVRVYWASSPSLQLWMQGGQNARYDLICIPCLKKD